MYQDPMMPRQEPTIPVSQPFQPPTQAASQPFYPPPPPPPPPSYYPPPSQPLYQPFPQPAKTSNTALKIGIVAIIFVVCIVATAAIAYQAGKNSVSQTTSGNSNPTSTNPGSQNTPSTSTTPVATTGSSQQHYKVGDQVQTSGWLIVLNSAKTSTGDQVFQPGAGHIFVEVDLSLQNQASQSQDMNIFDFTLRSQDGTPYMAALSDLPDITGTIVAGGKDRGGIDFEVPQTDKTFALEFVPDFESVAAIWDISV